jgi:hypothetical protein
MKCSNCHRDRLWARMVGAKCAAWWCTFCDGGPGYRLVPIEGKS